MFNFIYGIVFTIVFVPILQSIAETACTLFEWVKAKCNVRTAKYNAEISKYNCVSDNGFKILGFTPQHTEAIGEETFEGEDNG